MAYISSDEVIENFTFAEDGKSANNLAYARAFGAVWAFLDNEQKEYIIKFSEEQRDKNNAK